MHMHPGVCCASTGLLTSSQVHKELTQHWDAWFVRACSSVLWDSGTMCNTMYSEYKTAIESTG